MSNQNHENANTYRDLCNIAGDVLKGKSVNLPNGQILKEHQAKEKTLEGNLIKVSDYVRNDGTQVDGYYRRQPSYAG